jgi:hypothetical protein
MLGWVVGVAGILLLGGCALGPAIPAIEALSITVSSLRLEDSTLLNSAS